MTATGVRHVLMAAATLVLAFKLWLSIVFPFTGDEAYFTYWGAIADYGFYDHPPMVGWLLARAREAQALGLVSHREEALGYLARGAASAEGAGPEGRPTGPSGAEPPGGAGR